MEVGLTVGCSILSAFLQVLFDRIASSRKFVDRFQGRKTIKIDDRILDKLEITLLTISVVLEDAENKQAKSTAVKSWLDKLKDAVYRADDLLDEINTEALRLKVESEFKGRESKVCDMNLSLSDEFLEEIMPKIEKVTARLEYFGQQVNALGLEKIISKKVASSRLPSTSLVDVSGVFGRGAESEKLIGMVLSYDARSSNLSVIPVVGLGGVGKTTLAQLVYNHERIEKHFQLRAWVCVSEAYDAFRVTKSLLLEVNSSVVDDKDDLNRLQIKLRDSLAGKRFLIILDDIWNENYNDWDKLKAPFKYGRQGSKIIITTRNDKVASMMQDVPLLHVKEISDEESWSLFKRHACTNGAQGFSPEFETIGKEIVKKCKGLPLAIQAVGGALRSKREVTEWRDFLRSEVWASGDRSDILPALSLSYYHLPSHLKRCFSFCALYPKDFPFNKEEVVLLWIANDLVQHSIDLNGKSIEEVGCECFDELTSRSLFQKMTDNTYVMHDLVNDLARYVSGKFCVRREDYHAKELPQEVRYFSYLSEYHNPSWGFESLAEAQSLRTFLTVSFHRYKLVTRTFLSDTLPRFQCLKVLSLYGYDIEEIPDSIGNLKHLRLINVSYTQIRRLPDSICNLVNLQTLLLTYCSQLVELPEDMRKLVKLRHLDVRGTRLRQMPSQLSTLKELHILSTFIVDNSNGRRIEELGELELCRYLEIRELQNVINGKDAIKAKLKSKADLEELVLRWSGDADDSENEKDILAKLEPNVNIKAIGINGYRGTRLPDWVGDVSFCNVVSLHVNNCQNCFSLPAFGQLPYLKDLVVSGMNGISIVGQEFYGDGSVTKPFQSLVTLKFSGLGHWEKWDTPEDVEFSSLEVLCIFDSPRLVGKLPFGLSHLKNIEIQGCGQFVLADNWMTRVLNNQVDLLPHFSSLQVVKISEMLSLKEFPEELIKLNLKELVVSGCPHLVLIPNEINHVDRMEIGNCPSLAWLPQSATMKELSIRMCVNMEFPTSGSCYTSLEILKVAAVGSSINDFPLASFPQLRILSINYWQSFKLLSVPSGHQTLGALSHLQIGNCDNLLSFPEGGLPAPNLQSLVVYNCKKLKSLPEQMHTLLPSLQVLQITHCPEIEDFPEGGLPSSLETLSVYNCTKLIICRRNWDLQSLPSLSDIGVGETYEKSFPEEWFLPWTVRNLRIWDHGTLEALNHKGLQHLKSLETLSIFSCPNLQSFPEEGLPTSVSQLFIYDCPNLMSLPETGLPASLSKLEIHQCPLLKSRLKREKGKDWPKVAHIPILVVDMELIS